MNKLIQNFPHQAPYQSPVALELEMEFKHMVDHHPDNPREFDRYWKRVREGSLRGHAAELTSRSRFNLDTKKEALALVEKLYKHYGAKPSVRSSTHVHVNMQEYTWKEVCTAMAVYWYLEPALLGFCGDHRVGNHFCLGVEEADYFPLNIKRYVNRGEFYTGLNRMYRDDLRYSALNAVALVKFGSLEFRAMRGTDDMELVDKWLQMCYDICKVGVQFKDPVQFLDSVYGRSPRDVAKEILGDNARFLDHTVANTNLGLLAEFAYDTDWDKKQDDGVEPQPRANEPRLRPLRPANPAEDDIREWARIQMEQIRGDGGGVVNVAAGAGGGGQAQWINPFAPIQPVNVVQAEAPEDPDELDELERLMMEEVENHDLDF